MYDSWDIWHNKQSFLPFWVIFCPLAFLKNWKSNFWKNEKKPLRYYHFTLAYRKWWSYDVWFLRHGAWETEFFVILDYFVPWTSPSPSPTLLTPQKVKILKNQKTAHRYTLVCHKWNSYDVCFLRYGVQHIIFFLYFGHFFSPFTPLTTQKIKILKKWKKCP